VIPRAGTSEAQEIRVLEKREVSPDLLLRTEHGDPTSLETYIFPAGAVDLSIANRTGGLGKWLPLKSSWLFQSKFIQQSAERPEPCNERALIRFIGNVVCREDFEFAVSNP